MSFTQRIKEVEDRFSGDQESVAERFQADVLKLEQHYQHELKALSESHVEQKLHWEAQVQKAFENGEEQRRMMEEAIEQERECQKDEWTKRRYKLENIHKAEMEELRIKNKQLQNELDDFISMAQTKEIELSRQLNDLHNRLQGSLETKDELLAQSENKVLQIQLLLNQTVEDFKQERAELLSNHSELEAKYKELLLISERQIAERIELLTERDDLKIKIDELEMLLKQAALDFELDKKELQERESIFKKLQDNLETEREELITERDLLRRRIKALEMELNQVLVSNELDTTSEGVQNTRECSSFSEKETCSAPEIRLNNLVILTESCGEEQVSFSPFLIELEGDVETMTQTSDALSGSPKNIINDDKECGKERTATNDDQRYDSPDIKIDDIENQGQKNQIIVTGNNNTCPEISERCQIQHNQIRDSSPKEAEENLDVGCSTGIEFHHKDDPELNLKNAGRKKESVSSSLEVFEGVDNHEHKIALELCEKDNKPQDVPTGETESPSLEDEQFHETVVDPSVLDGTGDLGEMSLENAEVYCLPDNSHDHEQEAEFLSDSDRENLTVKIKEENSDCAEHMDEDENCDDCSLLKLQALYNTATEENILLHEKIALLQQKSEILENLLAHNSEKIKTSHQVLEENYTLKVKMLLLMEHVKELETKALKTTDLQIRYEDCMCENAKLKDQNDELERRVWSLESRMNICPDFQDEQVSLVDEISNLREKNTKLSELISELDRQDEILSAMHPDHEQLADDLLDLTSQPEIIVQLESDLENCCVEFEKQNTKLRRAITELQDKSQTLNETTLAHR